MARRPQETLPKERLSPSEWEIMRICWRLGRCTVREVLEEDLKSHNRDYRTILTFMTRMAGKGWLKKSKRGNKNHYTPAASEKAATNAEIDLFLREVIGANEASLELLRHAVQRAQSKRR